MGNSDGNGDKMIIEKENPKETYYFSDLNKTMSSAMCSAIEELNLQSEETQMESIIKAMSSDKSSHDSFSSSCQAPEKTNENDNTCEQRYNDQKKGTSTDEKIAEVEKLQNSNSFMLKTNCDKNI